MRVRGTYKGQGDPNDVRENPSSDSEEYICKTHLGQLIFK